MPKIAKKVKFSKKWYGGKIRVKMVGSKFWENCKGVIKVVWGLSKVVGASSKVVGGSSKAVGGGQESGRWGQNLGKY